MHATLSIDATIRKALRYPTGHTADHRSDRPPRRFGCAIEMSASTDPKRDCGRIQIADLRNGWRATRTRGKWREPMTQKMATRKRPSILQATLMVMVTV